VFFVALVVHTMYNKIDTLDFDETQEVDMSISLENYTAGQSEHYTTALAGYAGMVEETLTLLDFIAGSAERLDFKREALFDAVWAAGLFHTLPESRVKRIIAVFWQRYSEVLPELVELTKKRLGNGSLTQMLFFHTARTNPILYDFMVEVYWPAYQRCAVELTVDDAIEFVHEAHFQQRVKVHWAESTIKVMASSLINACIEFGLLRKTEKGAGSFNVAHSGIDRAASMLVAYSMRSLGFSDAQISSHYLWRLFGLDGADVHAVFKNLSLEGWIVYQNAGHLVRFGWLLDGHASVMQAAREYYGYEAA